MSGGNFDPRVLCDGFERELPKSRQGSGSGVIGARESKSGFAGGAYEWEQVLVLEGFGRELSKSREGCWDVGTGVKENKLQ